MFHERIKHIYVMYYFVCDVIVLDDISVSKVDTNENLADILIKPLPTAKFEHYLDLASVCH